MVLFLRSRKDAVLFSSYVSQHKCQVTLNLRFALCMSWRSMVKSRMRTQVFREGMPVAVRFKQAQVFVFIMNRFVNFLVSFHILIAIILTAYNEQLFLSSALKSVISLCEIVYIGVYGQLKVPLTRLRHYSLQDTFILCFRHKNLLVLSFLNDLLFFYEIHTLTHTSLHFLFQTGKETISQLVDCSPFLSLSAWNRPILCFSTHCEYLNCVEFSWSKKILQWTTTKLKELFKPSRQTDFISAQMKPTCSSDWKSSLYCAMSSGGLFWTRLRHSSQMPKPTINMPISGMNTRMPFPASAPLTLGTNRQKMGHRRWQKADARFLKVQMNPKNRDLEESCRPITHKGLKLGQDKTGLTARGQWGLIWSSFSEKSRDSWSIV